MRRPVGAGRDDDSGIMAEIADQVGNDGWAGSAMTDGRACGQRAGSGVGGTIEGVGKKRVAGATGSRVKREWRRLV